MRTGRLIRFITCGLLSAAAVTLGTVPQTARAQPAADDPEQSACMRQFDPALVTVAAAPVEVTLDSTLDSRALTRIEGKGANLRVLGRTTANLRNTSQFSTREQRLPSGRMCVRPAVTVTIAYQPAVIYVGSEYPAGSCAFRRILAHEQRHVDAYGAHLAELALLLQQDLRGYLAAANPVTSVPGETRRRLQAGIQELIRTRITLMAATGHARQLGVDSDEEIGKLSELHRLCAGEQPVVPGAG